MARHLLITNDFPPKTGGIQVYLHELWGRLEPGRAVILTANSHPEATSFDENSDLVIERVPHSTLFAPTLGAYRAIEAAIERHQPELVLLDPAWPLGLLGPRLSRPYGVVLHGAEVTIPARIPLVASSLRYVLRHASVVVAAGQYCANEARRNAAEWTPPIIQVPPGVDSLRFRPLEDEERLLERERRGVGSEDFLVVSYSRLVPRKGMDTLIEAAALLQTRCPHLRVQIGGLGRDRARLERLASTRGAPVEFLGRVPDEDLPTWLGSADVMVMDCRRRWAGLEQEGFGMVFVEAASCAVPQIAGRSGGSHEAVRDGETGIVLDNPRSAPDLARALDELWRDPTRRREFADASRSWVQRGGDWSYSARRLADGLAPFDSGWGSGAE
ncbi:MAG: glycosyltransferase family 4 protein [Acidimicrobiaceae bacterium]|nr:glycosyltransferase family 4 protein [Acidimicrobiaceae bacterium]